MNKHDLQMMAVGAGGLLLVMTLFGKGIRIGSNVGAARSWQLPGGDYQNRPFFPVDAGRVRPIV